MLLTRFKMAAFLPCSELLGAEEEEENLAAVDPSLFTPQKSTASVTSSEPTGTDSHCEDDHIHSRVYSCSGELDHFTHVLLS